MPPRCTACIVRWCARTPGRRPAERLAGENPKIALDRLRDVSRQVGGHDPEVVRAGGEQGRIDDLRKPAVGVELRFETASVQLEGHAVVIEALPLVFDPGGECRPARRLARTRRRPYLPQVGRRSVLQEGESTVAPEAQRQTRAALLQVAPLVGPARAERIPAVDAKSLGGDGAGG